MHITPAVSSTLALRAPLHRPLAAWHSLLPSCENLPFETDCHPNILQVSVVQVKVHYSGTCGITATRSGQQGPHTSCWKSAKVCSSCSVEGAGWKSIRDVALRTAAASELPAAPPFPIRAALAAGGLAAASGCGGSGCCASSAWAPSNRRRLVDRMQVALAGAKVLLSGELILTWPS